MRTCAIGLALVLLLVCQYGLGQSTLDTVYTPAGYEGGPLQGTVFMPTYPNGIGVILVHGSGATRSVLTPWCEALAARGYTAMTVDFTTTVDQSLGAYPRATRAIKTAVQFLRRNAVRFNIFTGRIVGFGFSAGSIYWGQSIIWDNDYRFFRTDSTTSDHLDAAVLFYGLYNTLDHLERGDGFNGNAMLDAYFGSDTTLRATKGNCIANFGNMTTPVLLFHGTADIIVHFHQSVQLNDSLHARGKVSQLVLINGAEHLFDLRMNTMALSTLGMAARDTAVAFLQRTVPHDVAYVSALHLAPLTARKNLDTVSLRATVENPQHHALAITAFLVDTLNGLEDSLTLYDDGHHGDSLAGDDIWGAGYAPKKEGIFGVSLRAHDVAAGASMHLPNVAFFASAGPVADVTYRFPAGSSDTTAAPGMMVYVQLGLKNKGATAAIGNVRCRIQPLSLTDDASPPFLTWPTLPPGQTVYSLGSTGLYFDMGHTGGTTVSFLVSISSNNTWFWQDTMRIVLTGMRDQHSVLPASYALDQNYPNPFNPATTIRYSLPHRSHVTLAVFNTLSQKVAELVNGDNEAGYHEVQFIARNLASGVYFYRLQAGPFVQTKSLMVLR